MKKILLLISFALMAGSSLNAYMLRFINKTGAPLTGTVRYALCSSDSIPANGIVDTKTCCFVGANLLAGGKSGSVLSEKHAGVQMTCGHLTYEVVVEGNRLVARKR